MKVKKNVKVVSIIICYAIAITFLSLSIFSKKYHYNSGLDYYENNYSFVNFQNSLNEENKESLLRFNEKDIFEDIYNRRIKAYENEKNILTTDTRFLITLIIIAFLMLVYEKKEEYTIPIISVKVPYKVLYIFTMLALLVLWVQYGGILNKSIDSRMALHSMTMVQEDNLQIVFPYEFSNRNILSDHGIIDVWCNHFYDFFKMSEAEETTTNWLSPIVLFIIYCSFWAGVRITIISLATVFYTESKSAWSLVFLFLTYIIYIFCEIAFVIEYHHSAFLIGVVWLMTGSAILILSFGTFKEKFKSSMQTKLKKNIKFLRKFNPSKH